jgi:hypothetical protein
MAAKLRTSLFKNPISQKNKIMQNTITALDLTQEPPHSPRERLAGFVIAKRCIDKCRATLAGTEGEYHYACPLDQQLFAFKDITAEQFQDAVQNSENYEDVGIWLLANGTYRTSAEIKAWSDKVEASSLMNDPAKRASFMENCKKAGLDPKTSTLFDWLEADDRASFPGGKK